MPTKKGTCPSSLEFGNKQLFSKSYDGESIVDLSRDIHEALDSDFNPKVLEIPDMEGFPGFWSGNFTVTITWSSDQDEGTPKK